MAMPAANRSSATPARLFPTCPGDDLRRKVLEAAPLERLEHEDEMALMKKVAAYPRVVEAAAAAHEPHRIAFYLYELASQFHGLWTLGNNVPYLRFIIFDDPQISMSRLALVQGVANVLASGLKLLGVEAPEEMR